jgi:LacI family transcriptional regulator
MRDVASLSGVSLKTVSRVVNGEPGVSAPLAERVRSAIDQLDFHPDRGASSLRRSGGRTATVGLLLEDVSNPWSSSVQRAIEDVALPRGVMVFSASLDESVQRERELVRGFIARRADGLILAPASSDQSYLGTQVRAGTAVVCIDREAGHLGVDSVITTNVSGAAEGVRHLLSMGHRRIAFLGDRQSIITERQRFDGYNQAMASAGLTADPALIAHGLYDEQIADGAVTMLFTLADPPTALFTAQNVITIGAVRALRRLGRSSDIAVVGFDDFPLADLLDPGVTVVAQDPGAIGKLAANVLFERIAGDGGPPSTHIVPTLLIRRGSGEIRPHS